MNRPLNQEFSWETVIQAVREGLQREFQGTLSPDVIETAARESVEELASGDVRILTFVPVLAGRRARRRLRDLERQTG